MYRRNFVVKSDSFDAVEIYFMEIWHINKLLCLIKPVYKIIKFVCVEKIITEAGWLFFTITNCL
jgi:hypothetical protein